MTLRVLIDMLRPAAAFRGEPAGLATRYAES